MATNEDSDLGAPSTSKSNPKCKGCKQLVQGHFLPTGSEKCIFSVVESLKARTTEWSARPEYQNGQKGQNGPHFSSRHFADF